MFDLASLTPEGRPSVVERLRRWAERHPIRLTFVVDFHRRARPPAPVDAVEPELGEFARLLQAGADHLGRATEAHLAQCREVAVQARELAAFAARRPVVVLDRPVAEVGSAAASRAARPAALTAVSEWAWTR